MRMMPDKVPAMNMRPLCADDSALCRYLRSEWGAEVAHVRRERGGGERERMPGPDRATMWDALRSAIRSRNVDTRP